MSTKCQSDSSGGSGAKRRKLAKNKFTYGEEIMFKADGMVWSGWIISAEDNIVAPNQNDAPNDVNVLELTHSNHPIALQKCKVSDTTQFQKGSTVYLLNDSGSPFKLLKKCVVLEYLDGGHVWVRLEDDGSIVMGCVENIFFIPKSFTEHRKTLVQLGETEVLLRDILKTMCNMTDRFKQSATNCTQLQTEVTDTQIELQCTKQQLATLQKDIQSQSTKMAEQNSTIQELNDKITQHNTTLLDQNKNLKTTLNVEQAKTPLLLEKQHSFREGVLRTRPKGSSIKFTTSVVVSVPSPSCPSSEAYQASLDKRVSDLKKTLEIISTRETDPRMAKKDLVATLAAFMIKNSEICKAAAKEAHLHLHKDLTPAECNDLRLLLRMPWKRFSELRTYLTNKDHRILASEGKMREELKTRRNDTIEVGRIKPTSTTKTSGSKQSIAYARTIDLEKHITDLVKRHMELGNIKEDERSQMEFGDTIWIKIGGDKGGSTTKLVVQICNVINANSADNTDLVAFYEGTDNDENMRLVFSKYTEVIRKMQQPGYELDLGEFGKKRCRIFLFGDYEFLCKAQGHLGVGSTYPCLWCYIKLEQIRKPGGQPHCPKIKDEQGHWVDREDWPEPRKVEDLPRDAEENIQRSGQTLVNLRANSKHFHSIYSEAIFPITTSMEHIVPPSLHILLGLVQRFFNMLETVCKSMDSEEPIEGRDLDKTWQDASEKAQSLEIELEQKRHELNWDEAILEGFRKSAKGEEGGGVAAQAPCDMPACALACINPWAKTNRPTKDAIIRWFQCSHCGDGPEGEEGWFHLSCVRLGSADYENQTRQFICPICDGEINGTGDVIRKQVEKVKQRRMDVQRTKENYEKQRNELDKMYQEMRKEMGPREKELNRVLEEDLKVKRQSYHSQCFVGNHCKIILNKHEALVNVIKDHADYQKYMLLFSKLTEILIQPSSEHGFFSQDQVTTLVNKCYDFDVWFPTNFVNATIPPKLHMIVCSLPVCIQTWYALGLLSEHGLEGIHAQCNADERTYCRIRDDESRLNLIFQQHGHYATADKSPLKVKKRRCQMTDCKGRYVTIDKVKQCNVCFASPEHV